MGMLTNSSTERKPKSAILRSVPEAADGHKYYVLSDNDRRSIASVHYLEFYSSLNQYASNAGLNAETGAPTGDLSGFFFVRHAHDSSVIGDGKGDPYVRTGWAMYLWDSAQYKEGVSNSGWVRFAQQTNVDWDIDDELKALFVLKTIFNNHVNEADNRATKIEARVKVNEQAVAGLKTDVIELKKVAHSHENKTTVLDHLTDQFGYLYYKNRPVTGNSFVYDGVSEGKLWWIDPTQTSAETPFTPVKVANSEEIAQKFVQTTLAKLGMSLFVIEVDGSITIFKFIRTSTGALAYKFAQTIVAGNYGVPEYVDLLPTANATYVGRGCWVPLKNDYVHVAGHLHKCVRSGAGTVESPYTYAWVDQNVGGETTTVEGAKVRYAFAEDGTLWTKNHIVWDEPVDSTEPLVKWGKTMLVRKFGSAPQHYQDGELVYTSTSRTTNSFDDITPFAGGTVAYYRLFTFSATGVAYTTTPAFSSSKLDWAGIKSLIAKGIIGEIFSVGDIVVLPKHNAYGFIECEVVGINTDYDGAERNGLLLAAKDILCQKAIDAAEGTNDGNPNPEFWSSPRGSNGALVGEGAEKTHDVSTLNVIQWLNATGEKGNWFLRATSWDEAPTYATSEAGFMHGFADTSIFSPLTAESELKCSLPNDKSWVSQMSQSKRIGRLTTPLAWVKLIGGPKSGEDTSERIYYGFKTINGTTESYVHPENTANIVPVFFIGA